ncbi:amidohydrolase [Meiothermus granaticius]|uniref:N-substituted formamide deformylase n=1 Tax=Meiothermus granaticius NBRC 107808 TaxID=1227551 RepID=A0A399F8Z1_9DEIN|nr:amidohydrolase [Meiothermus granaticius]RIH92600.1 N-substituted formamide deformylase [Meiothermus granaticius NBRC 107808]GEM87982.1 amidohydrolase [Meiothermus granaticius NBRC 107808]
MLLSGNVWTMTELGQAEAVYLEGNRIAAVGGLEDLRTRYPGTRSVRLERITPGLHDAHTHPLQWGEALGLLDLAGVNDPREAAQRVAAQVREIPPGAWIRGVGYLFEGYPSSELLDQAAPHHPVFLRSRDLHSGWANRQAMEAAGLSARTPDPPGGALVRDSGGNPSGYLLEHAQDLLLGATPKPGLAELERGLRDLAARGYTATHHMGSCPLELAERLARSDQLPLRLWWALDKEAWRGVEPGWRGERLEVAAVKFFVDGALGSRTAWMVEPYPDGSHGMPLDPLEFIHREGAEALRQGFGVVVHAIGTQAVRGLLDVFSGLAPLATGRPLRMEHVQHVRDEDLPRFRGLPLALSLQPMHALEDAALVRHHLPGREHEAFRLRDLWATGLPLAFGSDAPVAKPEVLDNLQAALHPPLGNGQALSLEQALWAHTRGAALAAGWNQQGWIRPGAPADLTLWEGGKPVGRVLAGQLELS